MTHPMNAENPIYLRQQARLRQQWLFTPPADAASLAEIVRWMGAVQAQEYAEVKWSLALRSPVPVLDVEVERAFNAGEFLRTHVLRPTWHLVAPQDIRWMLELSAPRVHAASAYQHRQQGLDAAIFSRSEAVIEEALRGGQSRTRAELNAALTQAGIDPSGLRSGLLAMHAELEGLICSGPRRGKQATYALLDERVPQAHRLSRQEALAELALCYFTSHGPATLRDFTWWSSLTTADARQALNLLREQQPFRKTAPTEWTASLAHGQPGSSSAGLAETDLDGQVYYFPAALLEAAPVSPRPGDPQILLLPTYDEFLVGYANFDKNRRGVGAAGSDGAPPGFAGAPPGSGGAPPGLAGAPPLLKAALVINAQVVGSWQRVIEKDEIMLQVAPFQPLTPSERQALEDAAARYGRFLGRQPRLTVLS
jgi:hypothetical protein